MKEVSNINSLRSFINKNQKTIIYVIIGVVFALIIIYSLNYYYAKKEEENQKELEGSNITTGSVYTNGQNVTMDNINDEGVTDLSNETIENTMKLFVNYCNNGDGENAFNLITEECKTALKYYDAKTFKEYYIDLRFAEPQEYSISRVSQDGNTVLCKVTFNGDMLATGGAKFTANDEYYTFVKQDDGSYKINVNNYIYGENKNTRYVFDDIDVKIDTIDTYSRYVEITMELQNNSDKTIAFTGYEEDNSVYLINEEELVYSSMKSEFDEGDILVQPGSVKKVTVRFNKVYSASNKPTKMIFSKVILDYQDYLDTHNRTSYSNYTSIQVTL